MKKSRRIKQFKTFLFLTLLSILKKKYYIYISDQRIMGNYRSRAVKSKKNTENISKTAVY